MELLQILIGRSLFLYLGGFVRFVYGTLIRKIGLNKDKYYSLKEYIHGSNRLGEDHWDKGTSHEFVNRIIGLISIVIIAILFVKLLNN
jgi:hypothetical protein